MDGTNGDGGDTGPAGPGSFIASGTFVIPAGDDSYPTINAYLPLTGYVATQVPAQQLDNDTGIATERPAPAQVVAQDQQISGLRLNFAEVAPEPQHALQVEATLLVSAGGDGPFVAQAGCFLIMSSTTPVSQSCPSSAILQAGDVAAIYVHSYLGGREDTAVTFNGTVALDTTPVQP